MVNGRFQGSNDPTFTTGVVTLATVKNLALPGQWTVLDKFPSAEGFRYVRYVGGNNSRTQVAEIEFFGVPAESRVATPEFSLSSGTYGGTQSISISTATPSATIRYTVDGSMPSETSTLYEGPVSVASSLRLRAIAYSNSLPYSSIRTADYVIFDPVVKLSGRHIGSPGSWSNLPHLTGDKAFDGLTSTIYDARNASGDWTGLDLGSGVAKQVVRIRFWERTNWTGRMRGGKFQGSSSPDFTSGVIDLATVTVSTPGKWVELASIGSTAGFRYLRYIGPNNAHCNVAEIEFYGLDGEPLAPGARFTRWVTDLATPSASLTEADLLATADPDGDGIANLVEYVMGTSPFSPNGAETLPALKVNSPDGMTFTFTRNPALTDITYTVEVSSALHDPASWTPIAASVAGAATVAISGRSAVVETGSDLKLVTVSDQTSGSDGSKRFFRLGVSH
jgi:hypothetical protein